MLRLAALIAVAGLATANATADESATITLVHEQHTIAEVNEMGLRHLAMSDIPALDCSGLEFEDKVARAFPGVSVSKGTWDGKTVAVYRAQTSNLFLRNLELLAASQNSPSVLKLHGHCATGEDNELIYLTEWWHERSMRGTLDRKSFRMKPIAMKLEMAVTLAGAMAAAHGYKKVMYDYVSEPHPKLEGEPVVLCHLDAGRILADKDGMLRLGSFAMAAVGNCAAMERVAGMPESGGARHDSRRDVLGLGCLLMQLSGIKNVACNWYEEDAPLAEWLQKKFAGVKSTLTSGDSVPQGQKDLLHLPGFVKLVDDCIKDRDDERITSDVAVKALDDIQIAQFTMKKDKDHSEL